MKLTKEQWLWLVKAPRWIDCDNGMKYEFIQTWDDDADPMVELISYNKNSISTTRCLSPKYPLKKVTKAELHYIWNQWKQQQSKVIHLTTDDILDRYKHLSIDEIIFSHTNITVTTVMGADKIILHHKGKTKILKNRYE